MKPTTATLNVSAIAHMDAPSDPPRVIHYELCAGTTVEVTGTTDGDETLCVLRDGRECWLATRLLS